MQRYCHETGGEAWSLARGNDDILYLQHEADLLEEAQENQSPFNFGQNLSTHSSMWDGRFYENLARKYAYILFQHLNPKKVFFLHKFSSMED